MGERFAGRYELVDHLGDGGGGTVWRAWDHKQNRYVATKLLRQRDAGALLRFVREQAMRVAHPHVVAPHGWAAEDDDVLLTMDLVRGGSVATLLADYGRLPVSMVAVLLDQLLDALAAVHAAGLVHRDVKPGNVLLEPTGTGPPHLRLADFGIAVALDDHRLTATGMVVGTPGYVAPEVLRTGVVDPRQDLWAVGVLARHMVTGVPPGSTPGGLPLSEADLPRWPRQMASALVSLLERMAAEDPASRPVDAAAARAELHALPPATDDGADAEPIEVFDHLPALPVGWSAHGPAGHDPRPPARRTALGTDVPGTAVTPTEPAAARSPQVRRVTERNLTPGERSQPGPSPQRGRARWRWWQLAGAALLSLVAVGLFALAAATGGAEPSSPGPTPTSSGSPDSGEPDSPEAPAADVTAGDACSFTEVGTTVTGAAGAALTCVLREGRYTWG